MARARKTLRISRLYGDKVAQNWVLTRYGEKLSILIPRLARREKVVVPELKKIIAFKKL